MYRLFFALTVFLLTLAPMGARAAPQYSTERQCGMLVNDTDRSVSGTISTNYDENDKGEKFRHQANFTLKPKEKWPFCTTGPYFDGEKVQLDLRSLIPLFTCLTRAEGEILIRTRRENDVVKPYALCMD